MARLTLSSPEEVLVGLGDAARRLRLHRNLRQAELAERADVSLRTLQRFEKTGHASTEHLVRLAFALGVEEQISAIFPRPDPRSIDEVLEAKKPGRKRARRSQ